MERLHLPKLGISPHSTTYLFHSIIFLWIFALLTVTSVQAYIIHLDAGTENECFHERVPIGVKLGFSFEVIEGGFFDVEVVIKDPSNVILHQEDRISNGKYTVEANLDGPYQFCFSNVKSSQNPKFIIFNIDRSDTIKHNPLSSDGTKADDETNKMVEMTESLMLATVSARHDVRFLVARDKIHRKINESTNATIVWWSGLEFILLLVVTLGQVWYLKRFFEIRRKA